MVLLTLLLLQSLPAPDRVVELEGETHHVQGIVVEADRLWVTAVDRVRREAVLLEYDSSSGQQKRRVVLAGEPLYHPGGIDADKESLWIPLAEYRPGGRSRIERRAKSDFSVMAHFEVEDHIGCLALLGGRLYGGNWDARVIYEWSPEGRLLRRRENPSGYRVQDWKGRAGRLIAAGMAPRGSEAHAVVWFHPATLEAERVVEAGKTSRGVPYVNEGLEIRDGLLYLLPEDTPSRLFVWRLDRLAP